MASNPITSNRSSTGIVPDFINDLPPTPAVGAQCNEETFRAGFVENEPPYCECARIGQRPLSWLPWIPVGSSNPVDDFTNTEISHEHIIFEQSGDNVGFRNAKGLFNGELFSEETSGKEYHYKPECYDGSVMRKAIAETSPPSWYGFVASNCQTYVDKVKAKFLAIVSGEK